MITVKNLTTGETIQVRDVKLENGKIIATWQRPEPGQRFMAANVAVVKTEETVHDDEHNVERRVLALADGYEIIEKAERQPKAKKDEPKAESQPTTDEQPAAVEVVTKNEPQPQATKAKSVEEYEAEIADTYGSMGVGIFKRAVEYVQANYTAALDETAVRRIASAIFAEYAEAQPEKMKAAKKAAKKTRKGDKKNEVYCAKFQRIVAKVSRGNNVYLYGPAGSGKSHTAEQVAEALGIDFYGQTTIQFAHDVRGYGDAGGNFQDTPFFKAFAFGGLYFQDEYDRSNAEAAIVLNSALANGWYDFPIVGRVEAHPDFRFMAAGNTLMTGADEEYVTGQEIDASSRDRFAYFFEIDYSHEVEMRIAHGNDNIVSFVEDVRQAIKQTGIKHVVSYRATAAMIDEVENENDLVACCDESIFKALDVDARREIYERLNDKSSVWAKALKKLL
jgi:MoxR-like ATPase